MTKDENFDNSPKPLDSLPRAPIKEVADITQYPKWLILVKDQSPGKSRNPMVGYTATERRIKSGEKIIDWRREELSDDAPRGA